MWSKLILTGLLLSSWTRAEDEDEDEEYDNNQPSTPRPPPPVPLKNLTDLVKMYNYEVEEFELIAADGQKLALFHLLPKKAGGPTIVLQHGLLMTPDLWCFKNDSLAFKLVDSGADVWLPSTRGNFYSRKHQKYNPDTDPEFWDFSFVEMAELDFPVIVDFVLEKTKRTNIYYIGYSMGTTIALIALSQKPEYNSKIKEVLLLAPVWHCNKYQFMVNKKSSIYPMVIETMKEWDDKKKWEAFPRVDAPITDHQLKCNDLPEMGVPYCEMGMDMIYGAMGEYLPAGAGMKVLKHFTQAYLNGKVAPWEFDTPELNRKAYNQDTPPEYDLKKIVTKVNVFWGGGDQFIDVVDAEKLVGELPNIGVKEGISDENFNHADFLMPTSAEARPLTEGLHQKIVKIVKTWM